MGANVDFSPRADLYHIQFPTVGLQILSSIIHLLGVSILAFLFSRRVKTEDFTSFHAIKQTGLPKFLVVLTLVDSWAFLFTAGVLIQGAGLELNAVVCSLGIFNCIAFYATSKVLIYLFLVEKIHIVWSLNPHSGRFHSPIYVACLIFVCLYAAVGASMIIERVAFFRDDGSCIIGLKRPASVTLLVYDLSINVLFTSLFLWPLYRATFRSTRVRQVATRTVWAAAVALTTSCINILVLTLMKGHQLGWLCLASCGADVVVNAMALFWVTSGSHDSQASLPQELPVKAEKRPRSNSAQPSQNIPTALSAASDTTRYSRDSRSLSYADKNEEPRSLSDGASESSFRRDSVITKLSDEKMFSDDVESHRLSVEHLTNRSSGLLNTLRSLLNGRNDSPTRDIQITVTTEFDVSGDNIHDSV